MAPLSFKRSTHIRAPRERVFSFHELPDAFERLVPPWEPVKILERADISKVGSRAVIEQKIFGLISSKWIAEHTAYDPPRLFEDIQISGPFRSWRHKHIFEEADGGTMLIDEIEYELPANAVTSFLDPYFIRPKLAKMFDYRHKVTKAWCESDLDAEGTEE